MSRWMVRTDTSNSAASAVALMRPRVCSSIRIERRRLANIFSGYHGYMTFDVMFRALHRHPQPDGTKPMTLASLIVAASLIAAPAFAADATDHSHDFDFLIGKWNVHHWRLKDRLAGSHDWVEFDGTSELWMTLNGHGTIDDNYIGLPSGPYRAV